MGRLSASGVEIPQWYAKVHFEKTGGTAGNSFHSPASAQAGIPVASGRLDARFHEGTVPECVARAANFAARLLQARSCAWNDPGTYPWAAQPFGHSLADAGAGAMAQKLYGSRSGPRTDASAQRKFQRSASKRRTAGNLYAVMKLAGAVRHQARKTDGND